MDMTGEYKIAAPRERVWAALNDPDILRQAIPGCEELNKLSDTELEGAARAKIGPVSARFKGKVTLSELNPPESYVLTGEGSGGAAGFAKGEAKVVLTPDGETTVLRYTVKATIGGKLAQLGQRLVDGAAKKMADEFFDKFSDLAGGKVAPPAEVKVVQQKAVPAPANDNRHSSLFDPPAWLPIAIIATAIIAVVVVFLF
ncbi:MAG: carbon monoxide dehydrogenase subunit G [Alphaproteobacteria bacterium]|nr:carbon monoxide dehydrogenase subunit G [Alphaproteobacteria bacterium]